MGRKNLNQRVKLFCLSLIPILLGCSTTKTIKVTSTPSDAIIEGYCYSPPLLKSITVPSPGGNVEMHGNAAGPALSFFGRSPVDVTFQIQPDLFHTSETYFVYLQARKSGYKPTSLWYKFDYLPGAVHLDLEPP